MIRKIFRFVWGLITFRWLRRAFRNWLIRWLGINVLTDASCWDFVEINNLKEQVRKLRGPTYVLFTGKLMVPKLNYQDKDEPELWVDYAWAERVVEWQNSRYGNQSMTTTIVSQTYQPKRIEEVLLISGVFDILDIKVGNISVHQGSSWPADKPFRVPERLRDLQVGVTVSVTLEQL